jgi:hypothetical protein
MTSIELAAANRKCRVAFVLIAFLGLWAFSGCGGGWQPAPRDLPKTPSRFGTEESGLNGPMMEDSRTHL